VRACALPLACARVEAVDLTSLDTRTYARTHASYRPCSHGSPTGACQYVRRSTRSTPSPNTRQYPHTSTARRYPPVTTRRARTHLRARDGELVALAQRRHAVEAEHGLQLRAVRLAFKHAAYAIRHTACSARTADNMQHAAYSIQWTQDATP
jgi:hypothetical protein